MNDSLSTTISTLKAGRRGRVGVLVLVTTMGKHFINSALEDINKLRVYMCYL